MHINFLDLFQSMQHQLEQPRAVLDENLLIELVERIDQKTAEIPKR